MKRKFNLPCAALSLALVSLATRAVENEYFPLIENSTYTYQGSFNGKEFSDTKIVKAEKREDVEFFYFIDEKDERKPAALIGINGIGRGLYLKKDGAVAVVECMMRSAINQTPLKDPLVILKNPPEAGQSVESKAFNGDLLLRWTVEGFEDVTVPAGTFKQCAKIKQEEIWRERKVPEQRLPNGEMKPASVVPEKKYTGAAWLAKGVGMVKWQRGTGRVDELKGFKVGEEKK